MTRRTKTEKAAKALDFLTEDIFTAFDNGATEEDIRGRVEAAFLVINHGKESPTNDPNHRERVTPE